MKKPRKSRAKKHEIQLPARLDYGVFETLRSEISARRGGPLRLVADKVEYLSAAAAELLIVTWMSWKDSGHDMAIAAPSENFVSGLEMLGISPFEIPIEDTR